jgi:hypothetical protein
MAICGGGGGFITPAFIEELECLRETKKFGSG